MYTEELKDRDPGDENDYAGTTLTLAPARAAFINVITLPNGRSVRLTSYLNAWRALLDMTPEVRRGRCFIGWSDVAEDGEGILEAMRRGLHNRINRHIRGYGMGKKWSADYFYAARRDAQVVNSRRVVHSLETKEARRRFPDRQLVHMLMVVLALMVSACTSPLAPDCITTALRDSVTGTTFEALYCPHGAPPCIESATNHCVTVTVRP